MIIDLVYTFVKGGIKNRQIVKLHLIQLYTVNETHVSTRN